MIFPRHNEWICIWSQNISLGKKWKMNLSHSPSPILISIMLQRRDHEFIMWLSESEQPDSGCWHLSRPQELDLGWFLSQSLNIFHHLSSTFLCYLSNSLLWLWFMTLKLNASLLKASLKDKNCKRLPYLSFLPLKSSLSFMITHCPKEVCTNILVP